LFIKHDVVHLASIQLVTTIKVMLAAHVLTVTQQLLDLTILHNNISMKHNHNLSCNLSSLAKVSGVLKKCYSIFSYVPVFCYFPISRMTG